MMRPATATPAPIPALAPVLSREPLAVVFVVDTAEVATAVVEEPVVVLGDVPDVEDVAVLEVLAAINEALRVVVEEVEVEEVEESVPVLSEEERLKKTVQSSGDVAPVLYRLMMNTFEMDRSTDVDTVQEKLVVFHASPSALRAMSGHVLLNLVSPFKEKNAILTGDILQVADDIDSICARRVALPQYHRRSCALAPSFPLDFQDRVLSKDSVFAKILITRSFRCGIEESEV